MQRASQKGLIPALISIGKEEGFRGYWKGNLPQVGAYWHQLSPAEAHGQLMTLHSKALAGLHCSTDDAWSVCHGHPAQSLAYQEPDHAGLGKLFLTAHPGSADVYSGW